MTVEQKKSRQGSYFPETKASLKKKYYGEIERLRHLTEMIAMMLLQTTML